MMKPQRILLVLAATAALTAQARDDHHGHDHGHTGAAHAHEAKAAHGGVVAVVKDMNYELVARPDGIALYVSDHGKPVDLKGASARLTLLSAQAKAEVPLAPAGDRLQGAGQPGVGAGTKAVALVTLAGQAPVTVKFSLK